MYKRSVIFMEYERGWGSKVESIEYFDNDEDAKARVSEFNSHNTATEAPDWYIVASLGAIVDLKI